MKRARGIREDEIPISVPEPLPSKVPLPFSVPDGIDANQVIEVPGLKAAFVDVPLEKFFLYGRQETLLQIDFLSRNREAVVVGPPGVGKSVVTWYFALIRVQHLNETVVWRHYDRNGTCRTSLLEGAEAAILEPSDLPAADVLIVDGITKNTLTTFLEEVNRWRKDLSRRVIFVSSEQGDLKSPEGFQEHEVMSWTEQEYVDALRDDNLRAQVRKNFIHPEAKLDDEDNATADADQQHGGGAVGAALVNPPIDEFKAKYFLAGGSCRFMFHTTPAEVMRQITLASRRVSDMRLVLSGIKGDKVPDAVNTLLQITKRSQSPGGVGDEKERFVVSPFAACLLSETIGAELIRMAAPICQHNPSFDGWIMELDFLVRIRGQADLVLHCEPDIVWPHFTQYLFSDPPDVSTLTKNLWLIPKRWNQGGYDAVRVEVGETTVNVHVHFVQVTRAHSHSFEAAYMDRMEAQLRKVRPSNKEMQVHFYLVVPTPDLRDFGCPRVDTKWLPRIRVCGFDRTKSG